MKNETTDDPDDCKPDKGNLPVSDDNSYNIVEENEEKRDFPNNAETNRPSEPPLIIQIQKEKGWTKENIISIVAVLISAILFVITLLTFSQTKRSVDIAAQAMKESIINDSIMRVRDSTRFSNDTSYANKKFTQDTISNNKIFEVSKNALKAQINYLKQSQKEFELENRPFVQVSEIKIDASGYNAFLSFKIINYGKFPADVLQVKYRVGNALSINENKILYFKTQTIDHNIYVASGVNFLPEFGAMKSTSTRITNDIINGNMIVYLDVEIRYTTYGSKKTYLHTSLNKIKYGKSNIALTNNDVEIK